MPIAASVVLHCVIRAWDGQKSSIRTVISFLTRSRLYRMPITCNTREKYHPTIMCLSVSYTCLTAVSCPESVRGARWQETHPRSVIGVPRITHSQYLIQATRSVPSPFSLTLPSLVVRNVSNKGQKVFSKLCFSRNRKQ